MYPVGLSYVSVSSATWIGIMFEFIIYSLVWGKIAGLMGGMIETISTQYSLSTFFLIFTVVSIESVFYDSINLMKKL
jgi:POT family proton-dependent oligopeptide transporter